MATYATLTEVHDELPDLGTDADNLLGKLIVRASAQIDTYTQRPFGFDKINAVRSFDGVGAVWDPAAGARNTRMLVPDLVSVNVMQTRYYTGAALATVVATDYFLGPTDRRPGWPAQYIDLSDMTIGASCFSSGFRTVSIDGVWGWAEVPEDVRGVCIQLVVRQWKARASGYNDPGGIAEQGGMPMGRMLTWEMRDTLEAYKPVQLF